MHKGTTCQADNAIVNEGRCDPNNLPTPVPNKAIALAADLAQFCGTENHYKHWTTRLFYTDGVKFLANQGGAYWLLDAIAFYQGTSRLTRNPRLQEFQLWILKVQPDHTAVLCCQEDDDEKPIIRQKIEYTDFPLPEIKLYVEGGVLLLPSEH